MAGTSQPLPYCRGSGIVNGSNPAPSGPDSAASLPAAATDGRSSADLLPSKSPRPLDQALSFDILAHLFVIAQWPSLAYASRTLYQVSLSPSVRARYLMAEFGQKMVFHPHSGLAGRRPRMFRQDIIILLLNLGADPTVYDQWLFRHAVVRSWIPIIRKLMSMKRIENLEPSPQNAGTQPGRSITGHEERAGTEGEEESALNWRGAALAEVLDSGLGAGNQWVRAPQVTYRPVIDIHHDEEAALILAAGHGHLPVIRILLDPSPTFYDPTAVTYAGGARHPPLHTGADIHARDDEALAAAAKMGHLSVVRYLIDRGADARADNSRALRVSVFRGDINFECTVLLLKAGADVHANNESCLFAACFRGDSSSSSSHALAGAAGSAGDNYVPRMPRHQPRRYRQAIPPAGQASAVPSPTIGRSDPPASSYVRTIKLLLEWGADVHAQNERPLFLAIWKGHLEIVDILLSHGANVHVEGDQPLCEAATRGHTEMVRLFIKHGADINACQDLPIRAACRGGHLEIVRMLVEAGVDVRSDAGHEALQLAARGGWVEVVKYMALHGADVHDKVTWSFILRIPAMRKALGIAEPYLYS